MLGLPCFAQAAMDDLAPAYTPAIVISVCPHTEGGQPDCLPFWLKPDSVFGFLSLTMLAAVHLGWACHPV